MKYIKLIIIISLLTGQIQAQHSLKALNLKSRTYSSFSCNVLNTNFLYTWNGLVNNYSQLDGSGLLGIHDMNSNYVGEVKAFFTDGYMAGDNTFYMKNQNYQPYKIFFSYGIAQDNNTHNNEGFTDAQKAITVIGALALGKLLFGGSSENSKSSSSSYSKPKLTHFKHCGVPYVSYFSNTPTSYGCKRRFFDDYTLRYRDNCEYCSGTLHWGTLCPNCNTYIYDWEGEGECWKCHKTP